jgi:DNA-binding IclR family transcriptional regulator
MGSHLMGTTPSVGTRWPAHATATGKTLLADLSDEELTGLLPQLPAQTPKTITDPQALRRELVKVRERGFATNVEELEPGYMAAGVPVRAQGGRVVAASGIGGPRLRLSPERLAEMAKPMIEAAARISERLGHRPAAAAVERALTKDARDERAGGLRANIPGKREGRR